MIRIPPVIIAAYRFFLASSLCLCAGVCAAVADDGTGPFTTSSELVVTAEPCDPNDCVTEGPTLLLDTPDLNMYGKWNGNSLAVDHFNLYFNGVGIDYTLKLTGFDIDSDNEVVVLLNGATVGYLSKGPDKGLNSGDTLALPASMQAPGQNQLQFIPKAANRLWGITNLLLSEGGPVNPGDNLLPAVDIVTPTAGTRFDFEADVLIEAIASDTDGSISRVLFYANSLELGQDDSFPYSFDWLQAPAGNHELVAVAIDNDLGQSTSAEVSVVVDPCDDSIAGVVCPIGEPRLQLGIVDEFQYGKWLGTAPPVEYFDLYFVGTGIDYTLQVTGFDIDSNDEVMVLLNGATVGYLSKGPDKGLNSGDLVSLPASGQTQGQNQLRFIPKLANRLWGITDLLLSEGGPVNPGDNLLPAVDIVTPTAGTRFDFEADVLIEAIASDTDGSISRVLFYANSLELGQDDSFPYSFDWLQAPAGNHELVAVAIDDDLGQSTSAEVSVVVDPCDDSIAGVVCPIGEPRLQLGIVDEFQYGKWLGTAPPVEYFDLYFVGTGIDYTLQVTGFDIDSNDEVMVLLNGATVGYLSKGPDKGLNSGDLVSLPASGQTQGQNQLRFIPKLANRLWGITDLLLSEGGPVNPGDNLLPAVDIVTPTAGTRFDFEADVLIEAIASDTDGSISRVLFYANSLELGQDDSFPYSFDWLQAPAGNHELVAVAIDNDLGQSTSAEVSVVVDPCDDSIAGVVCPSPGASVIDAALATMAPNTWQKININEFQDVWTPVELRPTSVSPSQNISGYSGAAWDSSRDHFYIWGGNIGMEEGNEVYLFDATTGSWVRSSLPSAIPAGYGTSQLPSVIGGPHDAPLSGESWDNVVYIENMDRLAILGVSRNSNHWLDEDGTLTGPYFWDPTKADPNKVGGSDGTGVDPTTPGGHMWENRDNQATSRKSKGSALYINDNGTDVVLFNDTRANLWRYTIDPYNSANDTWKLLAQRPNSGKNPRGAAAYDPVRNIYVRSAHQPNLLLLWDLNREADGVFKGDTVMLDPSLGLDIEFANYGMDYDPVLDKLVLWGGEDSILYIDFDDLISVDTTNLDNIGGFFTVDEVIPPGMSNPYDTAVQKFTGVFGKWHYMQDKNAYIGVIDPIAGDVYLYKGSAQ